jgi:hypothetical protein
MWNLEFCINSKFQIPNSQLRIMAAAPAHVTRTRMPAASGSLALACIGNIVANTTLATAATAAVSIAHSARSPIGNR